MLEEDNQGTKGFSGLKRLQDNVLKKDNRGIKMIFQDQNRRILLYSYITVYPVQRNVARKGLSLDFRNSNPGRCLKKD